jgi:hypothetical protein
MLESADFLHTSHGMTMNSNDTTQTSQFGQLQRAAAGAQMMVPCMYNDGDSAMDQKMMNWLLI